MVEGIFLRVPANVAKKQLEQRASYTPDSYLSAGNAAWSRINIQVLSSLFTSSKISAEYQTEHNKYIKSTNEMDGSSCYKLKAYIKNLAEAIESFPQAPSQTANIADELVKLTRLRAAGALSPEEFDQAKAKLLG